LIDRITPPDLAAWLASTGVPKAVLLDVREPWELNTASVNAAEPSPGFELVTIPMGQIPQRLTDLSADVPVACLCHHGARSLRVASFLVQQGFTHVANIEGGIDAWSALVDPKVPRY
jgi:rhodanese-related sulfurtransferase